MKPNHPIWNPRGDPLGNLISNPIQNWTRSPSTWTFHDLSCIDVQGDPSICLGRCWKLGSRINSCERLGLLTYTLYNGVIPPRRSFVVAFFFSLWGGFFVWFLHGFAMIVVSFFRILLSPYYALWLGRSRGVDERLTSAFCVIIPVIILILIGRNSCNNFF